MKTLFLILALAGSVNAMPGCTTGGAPLYLQIPTLGASGDQFANCLAYDFAFISTATPIGINLGSTQTWTGANTFTSTSTLFTTPVYFGTYVYIGNTGFHATAFANTTSNNFIDLNTKAGSGGGGWIIVGGLVVLFRLGTRGLGLFFFSSSCLRSFSTSFSGSFPSLFH